MAKEKKVKPAAKRKAPAAKGEPKGTELAPLFGAPFHNLRDEIDRVFESFMQGWPHMRAGDLLRSGGGAVPSALPLSPRADLTESDDAYEMTVELPGLETGDIDISVKNGMLTVKGEKKVEKEERKKEYYLSERSYGSFQRSLRLPDDVAVDKITASAEKGVLSISLPKSAGTKAAAQKVAIGTGKK